MSGRSAKEVRVGIIGAGLMGRELAAAIARWPALLDHPVAPMVTAACDVNQEALGYFRKLASVRRTASDYRELLEDPDLDVLYIAVPHDLHEQVYLDAIAAGKDFLAEKPFGIDLRAAAKIVAALAERPGVFVRCSSEMPFYPGAQAAYELARSGALGTLIEANSSFLHSSDLDPAKPINWKRRVATCGEIGVMGDLGMHTVHVPLRLGWMPTSVYAVLQDIVRERPERAGGEPVRCDTIDNATLLASVAAGFPLTLEQKRIAPGQKNTWRLRVLGMDGGVEFSTRYPKTLRLFARDGGEQLWSEQEMGSQSVFPTVTGAIFEFGFPDAVLQMWAAFLAEREGALGDRFGCATPEEALAGHRVFDAALRSAASGRAEAPTPAPTPGP